MKRSDPDMRARIAVLREVFLDAPTIALLTSGPSHVVEFINQAGLVESAVREQDAVGRPALDLFPTWGPCTALFDRALTSGAHVVAADARLAPSADGRREAHFRFTVAPWRAKDGGVAGLFVQAADVTEEIGAREEQAEVLRGSQVREALADAERMGLRELLDSLPAAVVVYSHEGETLLANRVRKELVGPDVTSLAKAAERTVPRREDGTAIALADLPASRALHGETVTGERLRLRRADGREAVMLANASPFRGPAGELTGAVLVLSDITEISELERGRRDLFSMANHDLRTPLTTIQGLTQLARRQARTDPTRADESLAKIERQCQRMLRLIGDLLDVARFETGAIPITPVAGDLAERVREAVARQNVDVRIALELPDGPVRLAFDVDRIDQVLDNLLSNALRHTAVDAGIVVSLSTEGAGALVRVRDRGPGIAPDERARLFTPFYQTPRGRSYGGTGLGLHISRRVAEAHGGRLWLEDTGPTGSTFTLELPL